MKYLPEAAPAPPAPAAVGKPKPPKAEIKAPKSAGGPVVAPIIVEKPAIVVPYALRRVSAVCGTGDATISIASFGGTVRLKKI